MTVNRANRKHWAHGDLVIHDTDAKEHRLLRKVLFYTGKGTVATVYAFPNELPDDWSERKKKHFDWPRYLHDPARFNIKP